MIFFINSSMPKLKSGIEHAVLKRFALFNQRQVDTKLVVRTWDPLVHENNKTADISDDQFISMFDTFQSVRHAEQKNVSYQDIDFGLENLSYQKDDEQNRYLVFLDQNLVGRINYWPELLERVSSVEFFDGYGNLYKVDNYDSRGFVSKVDYYTADNKIGNIQYLNLQKKVVLETSNKKIPHSKDVSYETSWTLYQNEQTYSFNNFDELTKYFFDQLNDEFWSDDNPNIFIVDRAKIGDWTLRNLKKPAYNVFYIHSSHTAHSQNPDDPILNNNYDHAMRNIDGFDAVIASTEKQINDIQNRFHPKAKLFAIPVGVVSNEQLNTQRIPVKDREYGKVIAFSRVATEKRLEELVKAVGVAHKVVPEITLDIYGYQDSTGNFKAKKLVEDAIKEFDLGDAVQMKGYSTEVNQIESRGMFYGVTSIMEGFNLAVMEALSNGLIAVVYDINYGPNEITQDGVNGFVVPFNDYNALGQAFIKVMQDEELAQKLSTGAYNSARRYSPDNVWLKWEELMRDTKSTWPTKLAAFNHQEG